MKKCDVLIVGAGPAGLGFANSLSQSGLNCLIVEMQSRKSIESPQADGREIALTHLSLKTMKRLGIWQKIPKEHISKIKQAQVLDGDSDYALKFDTKKTAVNELGYMVPNYCIRQASFEALMDKSSVEIITSVKVTAIEALDECSYVRLDNGEQIKAKLVVGADSRFSQTRRMMGISADLHDFGRAALVCRMRHEKAHQQTATECFHYGQTLAVLPLNDHISSIVITLKSPDLDAVMAMSEEQFSSDVAAKFSHKLGKMTLLGERFSYPLVATFANRFYAKRFALIGDAAVGMHPVTAHGFNLGLRSQDLLAKLIIKAVEEGQDIADQSILRHYNQQHRHIARPLYLGTNGIVSIFTNESPLAKLARKGLLRVGNRFPPIRKLITNQLTEEEGVSFWRGLLPN